MKNYSGKPLAVVVADDLSDDFKYDNGKVKLNLPAHMSTKNGYQKLPSGIIIQWGNNVVNASSHLDITLPVAYTTTYAMTVMLDIANNYNRSYGIRSNRLSKSKIRLINADTGGDYNISWMTIGY